MEPDTLAEVLDIESEIKETLEAEKQRALRWLEQTKRQIQQATEDEVARLKQSAGQREALAKQAAADQAAEVERRAVALADRVDKLDDRRLRQLVWPHIAGIAPQSQP